MYPRVSLVHLIKRIQRLKHDIVYETRIALLQFSGHLRLVHTTIDRLVLHRGVPDHFQVGGILAESLDILDVHQIVHVAELKDQRFASIVHPRLIRGRLLMV